MANGLVEQLNQFVDAVIAGRDVPLSEVERSIAQVAEIALELRGLPRPSFKARLQEELQRSATIITAAKGQSGETKPVREALHTVTPYLTAREALELIDFVKEAFGAEGTIHGTGSAGGIHAEYKLGDSIIMIGGGSAWRGTPMPTALHYYVDDVDAVYRRALAAGATSIVEPLEDHGERVAGVRDLAGNEWYIARRLEGSHTDEGLRTVTPYLHPKGSLEFIGFLKRAFQAEEIAVYQSARGIVEHAKIRIGDSVIEMGEAHGQFQPLPTMFFLSVDDVDAWHARAVAAGAKSISDPADQSYGSRTGGVADSFDNIWYIAAKVARKSS